MGCGLHEVGLRRPVTFFSRNAHFSSRRDPSASRSERPRPSFPNYAQSRFRQYRRQPQRRQINAHESPHGRAHFDRYLQGANHAPPHHGYYQHRRLANRVFGHPGRVETQLQTPGIDARLLRKRVAGRRCLALRDRCGGETRQECRFHHKGAAHAGAYLGVDQQNRSFQPGRRCETHRSLERSLAAGRNLPHFCTSQVRGRQRAGAHQGIAPRFAALLRKRPVDRQACAFFRHGDHPREDTFVLRQGDSLRL